MLHYFNPMMMIIYAMCLEEAFIKLKLIILKVFPKYLCNWVAMKICSQTRVKVKFQHQAMLLMRFRCCCVGASQRSLWFQLNQILMTWQQLSTLQIFTHWIINLKSRMMPILIRCLFWHIFVWNYHLSKVRRPLVQWLIEGLWLKI